MWFNVAGYAKENGGSTAGSALLRGEIGARASALGGAHVAGARGAIALRYNPAILVDQDRRSAFLQYDASILDIRRNDLIYATPWAEGGLAIGGSFLDYGSITRTTISNPGGAGTLNASDLLLRVGYGRSVNDRYDVGGSLAYYRLELDKVAAHGVTADLGLRAKTSWDGLVLGAAIRNIGSRATFIRGSEELPLSATLGLSYQAARRLNIMTDFEWIRGLDGAIKAGAEYEVTRQFSLRAGYDGRNEAGSGLTFGAGFAYSDLQLDYAFIPFGDLGDAHRISAEWSFGTAREVQPREHAAINAGTAVTMTARPGRRKLPTDVASASTPRRMEIESRAPREPDRPIPERENSSAADEAIRVNTAPVRVAVSDVVLVASAPVQKDPDANLSVDELLLAAKNSDQAGEKDLAVEYYGKILDRDPEHQVAHYNLATIYFHSKDYTASARYFGALTELAPQDAEAWLFLAISQDRFGQVEKARHSYGQVLELDPENAYARRALEGEIHR